MAEKAGRGRPKITAETPLSDQEEDYVRLLVSGLSRRRAMAGAGYHIGKGMSHQNLNQRALRIETKPNVAARMLALNAQRHGERPHNPVPPPPPGVDAFDPENITPNWIIAQAHTVFTEAIASEDYGSSLRSLDFIAKFTGLIARPVGPGRPKSQINPNQGDMSGNFSNSDDAGTPQAPGSDQDAFGFDDGDGTSAPAWDEPFFKMAAPSPPAKQPVSRVGTNRDSSSGAGVAREDGEDLSEEAEGE